MTTCLGKNCSFGLPHVPFVNCCQFIYLVISLFGFEGMMWDLILSVPDHCLSFYFLYICYIKNYIGTQGEVCTVKRLSTPGSAYY